MAVRPRFLLRLLLDGLAAGLLLFGLSYWWLGNTAHELAGTAMFLLLIAHNVFNRRFYGSLGKRGKAPREVLDILLVAALLAAMALLLVTSVLISHALSGALSAYGGFTARQLHTLAAYWALVIVALHLGLRWPLLMDVARALFGISRPSLLRTGVLRAIAAGLALCGVWSSFQLDLGAKLSMQVTLDWWNFEDTVAGFFGHCLAIVGLYTCATYYVAKGLRRRTDQRPR